MEVIPDSDNQMSAAVIVEETRIRRPANAFMLFGQQYRKVLALKFDNLSNKQISKILGDEWKKMDANTKSQYHSLAKEVYRTHLEKYPDYHYNPLEARQRKAERKRKYKTSHVTHKPKANSHYFVPIAKPFGGNRSISLPNTTFSFSQTTSVPFIQPIINGTGDSVIGIKKLNTTTVSEDIPEEVVPIEHKEHNYSFQHRFEHSFAEDFITFENNVEQQFNEIEVRTQQTNDQNDWNQSFDYLVNFLPPMHNPSTEVTPVFPHNDHSLNEDQQIDGIKQEVDTSEQLLDNSTLMGEQMDLAKFIKAEVLDEQMEQLFIKEPKVVVKRIPQ